ncbi:MAG: hypothetical protein IJC46_03175 [Clostridia bacterium]|nr:hypothetical protein [Clostridia bacterium]
MITKKTRLMSAFAALLMLVSMLAMIVLPASAATYFDDDRCFRKQNACQSGRFLQRSESSPV